MEDGVQNNRSNLGQLWAAVNTGSIESSPLGSGQGGRGSSGGTKDGEMQTRARRVQSARIEKLNSRHVGARSPPHVV